MTAFRWTFALPVYFKNNWSNTRFLGQLILKYCTVRGKMTGGTATIFLGWTASTVLGYMFHYMATIFLSFFRSPVARDSGVPDFLLSSSNLLSHSQS
jgi:hypothetical protein